MSGIHWAIITLCTVSGVVTLAIYELNRIIWKKHDANYIELLTEISEDRVNHLKLIDNRLANLSGGEADEKEAFEAFVMVVNDFWRDDELLARLIRRQGKRSLFSRK